MARNATDESSGFLRGQRYLLHDRDTKFCAPFLDVLRSSGIQPLALPARSPNLNAFAERWVGSIRQECLSKLILFGEASLRRALSEYIEHHHFERNHQGKGNLLLFPSPPTLDIAAGASTAVNASAVCSDITPERLDYLTTRHKLSHADRQRAHKRLVVNDGALSSYSRRLVDLAMFQKY